MTWTRVKEIIQQYTELLKGVPFFKYARVLPAIVLLVAVIAYFKLHTASVFAVAFGVIAFCFVAFIASSFLAKNKIAKILTSILMVAVTICITAGLVFFIIFMWKGEPRFFQRWFPGSIEHRKDSTLVIPPSVIDSSSRSQGRRVSKNSGTQPTKVLSIRLKAETSGYRQIKVNDNNVTVNVESTRLNPRITLPQSLKVIKLTVVTIVGDTCVNSINIDSEDPVITFILK